MDWPAEKNRISARMEACKTVQQLGVVWRDEQDNIKALRAGDRALGIQIENLKDWLKPQLMNDPTMGHPSEVPT